MSRTSEKLRGPPQYCRQVVQATGTTSLLGPAVCCHDIGTLWAHCSASAHHAVVDLMDGMRSPTFEPKTARPHKHEAWLGLDDLVGLRPMDDVAISHFHFPIAFVVLLPDQ